MKTIIHIMTALLLVGILAGCEQQPKEVLTVLAGSELKDIDPKLRDIEKNTGVRLEFQFIGTLDGADSIINSPESYDLAWFSHAKYLSLLQGKKKVVKASEQIGLSPVIPAVKESLARKWGWLDKPVTWADIAEKSQTGEFRFAMTDPTASNTGFSTVMGVQAAFTGSSDVITAESVDTKKLKDFYKGHTLTSGSSGWLVEAYTRDQDNLDGMFNYESMLMALNDSGRLQEKLVLIYPQEGVVTADYPLLLLNSEKKEAYTKVVDYLKAPDFQNWMMENTNRRPVITGVKLAPKFPKGFQLELPFPNSLKVVNEILFSFLDKHRKPSHSIFIVDVSGSMEGPRLKELKNAIKNLTGKDQSLTGQFSKFRDRERISIIEFSNEVHAIHNYEVSQDNDLTMSKLNLDVDSLVAGGGTAIYDAVEKAYLLASREMSKDRNRFYSIVLMTDGASRSGMTLDSFLHQAKTGNIPVEGIKTFPVLFGDSDDNAMSRLAEATGGKVFDSRKHSLSHAFKQIRAYQ